MRVLATLFFSASFLVGCNATPFVAPTPEPVVEQSGYFAASLTPKLDLLFVVDNSGSMKTEQLRLGSNFKHMMEAFSKRAGTADLHIAVVSTDVGAGDIILPDGSCNRTSDGMPRPGGDRGEFKAAANCGLTDNARFLSSVPGAGTNFTGDLPEVFACIADLGTKGCGYEHHLLSVRLALDEAKTPSNKGFLRPDAALGIIFITDEDDCSASPRSALFADLSFANQAPSLRCALKGHVCGGKPITAANQTHNLLDCEAGANTDGALLPVKDFVDFVKGLKAGSSAPVLVSAIAGWPATPSDAKYALGLDAQSNLDLVPVCKSSNPQLDDTAYPALRLKSFIEGFGRFGRLESICNEDFRPALQAIGDGIATGILPRCVPGRLKDVDSETHGLQANCVVTEVAKASSGSTTILTPIPACTVGGAKPCWRLVTEDQGKPVCDEGTGAIEVDRNAAPAAGAMLEVRCEGVAN